MMQTESLSPDLLDAPAARSDRDLALHLQQSEIYRDYQKAFESMTGLPLTMRVVGSFQPPWHGSGRIASFCALMAQRNKSCAACLQLQERMETAARDKAATLECFAGLSDTAVPIKMGERVVAFLQTGQIFLRPPSAAQFRRTQEQLAAWKSDLDGEQVRAAYFETRVLARPQHESVIRLLTIFAQHLSSLSNQIMTQDAAHESPSVTKARQYISEHFTEEISLADVARASGMSAFYFCKVFKKSTGLTFTEYLARVRVKAVKQLLLNPHKRVSEAAYEVGFQSLSQFNRVFKRFTGEAPSAYRDKLHDSTDKALPGFSRLTHAA